MEVAYDCERLADDWDQSESIRGRLRDGQFLVVKHGKKVLPDSSIGECVTNGDTLAPALTRLMAARGKLPDIQSLRDTVVEVYKKSGRVVHDDRVDDDSWEVRKMLRFVKRKAGRGEVSTAPRLKFVLFWQTAACFLCFGAPLLFYLWAQDSDFQSLVLLYKPELQATKPSFEFVNHYNSQNAVHSFQAVVDSLNARLKAEPKDGICT